jgi:predicted MPP superfamily phosphohydrolase
LWILTLIALFLLFIVLYKAYLNTFEVEVRHVKIPVQLPRGKELRILQLSDMHLENLSVSPKMLYDLVKDMDVDLIALTGDQIERKKNIQPFMEYIRVLKKLDAPLGIYVIFGNHDYVMRKENQKLFRVTLEKHGCVVLQNENRSVPFAGSYINIIGIDDFSTRRSNVAKSYQGIREDGINLVLTHDPNIVLHMKDHVYHYLLSGHFHGGQIHWPKPYHLAKMGKLARMKIIKGLHYHNGKPYYISEGLGQTGINIRTGSRPEITIHTLVGVKEESLAEAM